ncbi:MAG: magnesium transporter [Patiriisocius sp.]|jgi:magnesium transporter
MQAAEINKEFIAEIKNLISVDDRYQLKGVLHPFHEVDIAEIMDKVSMDEAKYIYLTLDSEIAAEVLLNIDEDNRDVFLQTLSSKEIAKTIIENIESDDAADVLSELEDDKKDEVISFIEDKEVVDRIVELMGYDEDSAGGLMGKEMVVVNVNWSVAYSIRSMKRQAENVENIFSVYVIDDNDLLLGTLSLRKLLFSTSSAKDKIGDIFISEDMISVTPEVDAEEVATIMQKYDLVVLPVLENDKLIGRITFDDVMDVMQEEAEKDYQMISGLTEEVDSTDSVWGHTRARLPWLLIGMLGGLASAQVIGLFDIESNVRMAMFIPLVMAMGGNVGVQSSSIIVQGLANGSFKDLSIGSSLVKELGVGLVNGFICSVLVFGICFLFKIGMSLAITVSVALFTVIVMSAIFGTLIPLTLNKFKIDPAVATGPFITTTNDIFGIFVYFIIGQWLMV